MMFYSGGELRRRMLFSFRYDPFKEARDFWRWLYITRCRRFISILPYEFAYF